VRARVLVVAVLASWTLLTPGAARPGEDEVKNIIANGSFELETNRGIADGWYLSQYRGEWSEWATLGVPRYVKEKIGQDNMPVVTVDRTQAAHGDKCLKVVNPSAKLLRSPMQRYRPIEPGATYTFSFYAKTDRPGLELRVEFTNLQTEHFTISDKWQRYTATFVADEDYPLARVHLFFHSIRPGTFWLDAVQLERGEQVHPYAEHESTAQRIGAQ